MKTPVVGRKKLYQTLRAQLASEDADEQLAAFQSIFVSDQYELSEQERSALDCIRNHSWRSIDIEGKTVGSILTNGFCVWNASVEDDGVLRGELECSGTDYNRWEHDLSQSASGIWEIRFFF